MKLDELRYDNSLQIALKLFTKSAYKGVFHTKSVDIKSILYTFFYLTLCMDKCVLFCVNMKN